MLTERGIQIFHLPSNERSPSRYSEIMILILMSGFNGFNLIYCVKKRNDFTQIIPFYLIHKKNFMVRLVLKLSLYPYCVHQYYSLPAHPSLPIFVDVIKKHVGLFTKFVYKKLFAILSCKNFGSGNVDS